MSEPQAHGEARTRSRGARAGLIGLYALGLLAFCAAALWAFRLEIATQLVRTALVGRGVPGATFRITALGPGSAEIRDLSLGEHAELRAGEIRLRYRIRAGAPRLDEVDLRDPEIVLDLRGTGPPLGSLHSLVTGAGAQGGSMPAPDAALALALPVVSVERGTARLLTTHGELRATFEGVIRPGPAEAGEFPTLFATAELASLELRDVHHPPYLPPLTLHGSAHARGSALEVELDGRALDGRASLRIRAAHDASSGSGRAQVVLAPLELEGAPAPGELVPRLEAVERVSGTLGGEIRLAWDPNGVRESQADLMLHELSFGYSGTRISGVAGRLRLESLLPLLTRGSQTLRVRAIESAGVKLTDAELHFRVLDGPVLLLRDADFAMAGGHLRLGETRIDPAAARHRLDVEVDALDLAELLGLLGVEGVSGSGRVTGSLPIEVVRDGVVVSQGTLRATGPGVLRIRSPQVRAALESGGEGALLLVDALEDFHFESLEVEVEVPERGTSLLRLNLLGNNPAVLDGHPFALNLKLETELNPLLRVLAAGVSISEQIGRRLRSPRP